MIPDQLLALVPGCEGSHAPLGVVPLPGGQGRNEVLRIDTSQGRFVWRHRLPPVNRPGSAALTELQAHRHAAAAGLAPKILAAAADGSWILMEHVDAPTWTVPQLAATEGLERLGSRLAMLHALEVPAELPAANAPAMALGYLAILRWRDPAAAAALEPLARRVEQVTAELAGAGQRRALVHGDLMVSNMLGPQPLLVDWEYAQASDPGWDFACLLSYYPRLEPALARLLGSAGLDDPETRSHLALQRERFALLNRLWERAYPAPGQGRTG
ncbi:MAG TPA: phosphotransferase [Steroidobacteraceae bacterium]|nr:phosphotransferase [Steroidobacteraceae bacterium]